MATKLIKRIVRELLSTDRRGKKIIVELEGGDMISFRTKGSRKRYSLYLGHCYRLAQIFQFQEDYSDKLKVYQEKKKAGFRNLRKPKRPNLPFNEIYFKALK